MSVRDRGLVWGVLLLACCACSEDESRSGGNAGSGGASGSAGLGGSAGSAGSGGSAGLGGSAGAGGSAGHGGSMGGTGATGGAGGHTGGTAGATSGGAGGSAGGSAVSCETYQGAEICSAACAGFPVTIELGTSIAFGITGALVCYAENPAVCFATNNTYSDGPAACSSSQLLYAWYEAATGERGFTTKSGWHVASSSLGTIEPTMSEDVTGLPDATSISVVVNDGSLSAPGTNNYQVVFAFAGTAVTFTSVTPQ